MIGKEITITTTLLTNDNYNSVSGTGTKHHHC